MYLSASTMAFIENTISSLKQVLKEYPGRKVILSAANEKTFKVYREYALKASDDTKEIILNNLFSADSTIILASKIVPALLDGDIFPWIGVIDIDSLTCGDINNVLAEMEHTIIDSIHTCKDQMPYEIKDEDFIDMTLHEEVHAYTRYDTNRRSVLSGYKHIISIPIEFGENLYLINSFTPGVTIHSPDKIASNLTNFTKVDTNIFDLGQSTWVGTINNVVCALLNTYGSDLYIPYIHFEQVSESSDKEVYKEIVKDLSAINTPHTINYIKSWNKKVGEFNRMVLKMSLLRGILSNNNLTPFSNSSVDLYTWALYYRDSYDLNSTLTALKEIYNNLSPDSIYKYTKLYNIPSTLNLSTVSPIDIENMDKGIYQVLGDMACESEVNRNAKMGLPFNNTVIGQLCHYNLTDIIKESQRNTDGVANLSIDICRLLAILVQSKEIGLLTEHRVTAKHPNKILSQYHKSETDRYDGFEFNINTVSLHLYTYRNFIYIFYDICTRRGEDIGGVRFELLSILNNISMASRNSDIQINDKLSLSVHDSLLQLLSTYKMVCNISSTRNIKIDNFKALNYFIGSSSKADLEINKAIEMRNIYMLRNG